MREESPTSKIRKAIEDRRRAAGDEQVGGSGMSGSRPGVGVTPAAPIAPPRPGRSLQRQASAPSLTSTPEIIAEQVDPCVDSLNFHLDADMSRHSPQSDMRSARHSINSILFGADPSSGAGGTEPGFNGAEEGSSDRAPRVSTAFTFFPFFNSSDKKVNAVSPPPYVAPPSVTGVTAAAAGREV